MRRACYQRLRGFPGDAWTDVAQQVWVSVGWLESFLGPVEELPRYLEHVAACRCADWVRVQLGRRHQRPLACNLELAKNIPARGLDPCEAARNAEAVALVGRLPERFGLRRAMTAYFAEEQTMRDIAAEMGVSRARVWQLCRQGVAALRATVGEAVL